MTLRIGQGLDVHAFAEGRRLVLGGIDVSYHLGLAGHSDADVLTHAIMDALLGAAGLGDIGRLFPDNDARYKDANSLDLLSHVMLQINTHGWMVTNVDATIIAQEPRLAPYIPLIRERLAPVLGTDCINIKATTSEYLGFTGRKEGIAAMAIILIQSKDRQKEHE